MVITLKTYIGVIERLHDLTRCLRQNLNMDCGKSWAKLVDSSTISIKTADIVIYDRHMDKWK